MLLQVMNTEEINISRKGTSDELYRELLNELGRYVYVIVFNKLRSCGTKEDVEECVSDVFAELFIIAEDGKCDDIRKMAGIIAKRRAVDYFRKLSVSQNKMVCVEYEEFSEFADTLNVEVLSDSNEVRRDILREIEALGEPDSTILMQKFYYNKTSSEIGKTLKMTASTVRSRCVRAIERLKISLASIGITRQELYFYRNVPTSITGVGFTLKSLDNLDFLGERVEYFKEKGEIELYALWKVSYVRTTAYYLRNLKQYYPDEITLQKNMERNIKIQLKEIVKKPQVPLIEKLLIFPALYIPRTTTVIGKITQMKRIRKLLSQIN